MQTIGILLISIGAWIVYCGAYGIPPIDTAKAVLTDPDKARAIIATAKAATATKLAALGINAAGGSLAAGANPFAEYKVSDTFAGHKKRGSPGGVDFGAPTGSPIVAPAGGAVVVRPNAGAMGNAVFIYHMSGYRSEFYHLSKFKVGTGDNIKAGTVVGLSGGAKGSPGAGSSTGAHIHWSVIDPSGKQVDPLTVLGKL